jgi:hypothetical protein
MQASSGEPDIEDPIGLGDPRRAWRIVLALLAIYVVGFAIFHPRVVVNVDESQYLRQTLLLLEGRSTLEIMDPLTGESIERLPSTYPIGTAVLMAPWVAAFGWRGAFVVAPIALVLAVVLLARLLRDEGRSPAFALLLLGFVPTLVMGRVAMSDMPSTAMVTLGLWLFWKGRRGRAGTWLLAGVVIGASAALRPPNVLAFVPLCLGTVVRRDRGWWALAAGGAAGMTLRLASSAFVLGDPFAARTPYIFEPQTLDERLPLFLFGLLVLVPGGLVLSLAYRGERRAEIMGTVVFFFAFFLFQKYSSVETSLRNRIVLALRYFLPLVPIMAFAMSESVPRLWSALLARLGPRARAGTRAVATIALWGWIAGLGAASFGVHWFMHGWAANLAEMHDTILEHVGGHVVLTNWSATRKFISELELGSMPLDRESIPPADVAALAARHGGLILVFLDRTDSEWWREQTERNAEYLEALRPAPELLLDRRVSPTDRLRIWRVPAPAG